MSVARLLLCCWGMARGQWSRVTDLTDAGLVRPAARSEHIGAWDEARQVLLIHGGSNLEGDLWAFDATSEAWTRTVTAVTPAARAAHAAGWDPTNQALWVHGGHNSQAKTWFRDVWRFQSGAWTLEFDGAGPSGRQAHVAVWVSSTSSLWVHGGWTGSRRLSDLWSYNHQAHGWQELAPVAASGVPPARSHHVAVWDGTGQALWMHGGYGDSLLGDLWTLAASSLSWTEVVSDGGPTARSGHAAVWDDANRRLWLHGGNDGFLKRELWRYETGSNIWSLVVEHAGPSGRWSHAAAWDGLNQVIYIHGGYNSSLCGDLWRFWVTTTSTTSTASSTSTSSSISTTGSTSTTLTSSTSATATKTASSSGQSSSSSSNSHTSSSSSSSSFSTTTSISSTSTTETRSSSSSSTSTSSSSTSTSGSSSSATTTWSSSTTHTSTSSSTSSRTSSSSSVTSSSITSSRSTSTTLTSSASLSSTSSSTSSSSTSTKSASSSSSTSTSGTSSTSTYASSSSASVTNTPTAGMRSTSISAISSSSSTSRTSTFILTLRTGASRSSSSSSTSGVDASVSTKSATTTSGTITTPSTTKSSSSTSCNSTASSASTAVLRTARAVASSHIASATATTTATADTAATTESEITSLPDSLLAAVLAVSIQAFCAVCACFVAYRAFLVAVIPFASEARLSELQPLPKPPGRKGQPVEAPVFRPLPPLPLSSQRSPYPPLVVLVHFQGALPILPRLWLVPESQGFPAVAIMRNCGREPQPSPIMPPSAARTARIPQRGSSDQSSRHEQREMSRHPGPQQRVPLAPTPRVTRLEPPSGRPHQHHGMLGPTSGSSGQRVFRSQPRVQLMPEAPTWPTAKFGRRLPKEPGMLGPFGRLHPRGRVICPSETRHPQAIPSPMIQPLAREKKQGQASPLAPSITRPTPRFPRRTPDQGTAAWIHEMLDPTPSLNAKLSKLPRPKPLRATYPERSLRADWQCDVVWIHEMLDSIYRFTSKEAKLQVLPLKATYPESFLEVHWPRDATWIHEILDSSYSFTSKEAKLKARPMGARYPELCLRVEEPMDATWIHEMLDSAYSFTSQKPTTQVLPLRTTYPERPLQANWTGIRRGLMPVHNSTPCWSQSRSERMPRSVSMSPGPGKYNPEYLSFEKYMPDRLRKLRERKEQSRRIAERAMSREAERQGLASPQRQRRPRSHTMSGS